MHEIEGFEVSQKFDSEKISKANMEVINAAYRVILEFFIDKILENETAEEQEKELDKLWNVAAVAMANTGMQVIGSTEDYDYVATFNTSNTNILKK